MSTEYGESQLFPFSRLEMEKFMIINSNEDFLFRRGPLIEGSKWRVYLYKSLLRLTKTPIYLLCYLHSDSHMHKFIITVSRPHCKLE